MNLHNDIMNLPDNGEYNTMPTFAVIYKEGHRDARHAAAELALKADKRIEELESSVSSLTSVLRMAQSWHKWVSAEYHYDSPCSGDDLLEQINKAMGEPK